MWRAKHVARRWFRRCPEAERLQMSPKLIAVPLTLAVMVAPVLYIRGADACPRRLMSPLGPGGPVGTHATRGIVRVIDANTMVIVQAGNPGIVTSSLASSTHREGVIVAGSTVSVRYREDGKNHVATAIALQRSKE